MMRLLRLEEYVARKADFPGHTSHVETSDASQHSQGPGLAHKAIPKPSGIYEDMIETPRSLQEPQSWTFKTDLSQSRSRWRKNLRDASDAKAKDAQNGAGKVRYSSGMGTRTVADS